MSEVAMGTILLFVSLAVLMLVRIPIAFSLSISLQTYACKYSRNRIPLPQYAPHKAKHCPLRQYVS